MKTIFYKTKKHFLPSEPWEADGVNSDRCDLAIRRSLKTKHNLDGVADEDLDKYDINFDSGSISAKVLIDHQVEQILKEQTAKAVYHLNQFSFDIKRTEIADEQDLEKIKQQDDFMGFITHPASNLKPDYYYFHVNCWIDTAQHNGVKKLHRLEDTVGQHPLFRSVIFFPRSESNLEQFKKDFAHISYREITDNALVGCESIPLDNCVIEIITRITEHSLEKEMSAVNLKNAEFSRYYDTTHFYEIERNSYIEDARIAAENAARAIQDTKQKRADYIALFLSNMTELQKYAKSFEDGTLDFDEFPMDLIKNLCGNPPE